MPSLAVVAESVMVKPTQAAGRAVLSKTATLLGHTQFVQWGHQMTAVQNLLVYGLGTVGTLLAARKLMVQGLQTELKENPLTLKDIQKFAQFSWRTLQRAGSEPERVQRFEKFWERQFSARFNATEEPETLREQLGEIAELFMVGAAGIGSAAMGGALAAGQEKDPVLKNQKRHFILRETVYQLVTNIAMCALGASSGTVLANQLEKTLSKGAKDLAHSLPMKATRFGLVVSGVLLSLLAGAPVSDFVYRKLVEPVAFKNGFNRLPVEEKSSELPGKRTVESMDWAIHYDDLLAALKLTVTKSLEAGVLPFFLFSAVRAGSGYTQGDVLTPSNSNTSNQREKNNGEKWETALASASSPAFASLSEASVASAFKLKPAETLPTLSLSTR
jgi:hypothetical protein